MDTNNQNINQGDQVPKQTPESTSTLPDEESDPDESANESSSDMDGVSLSQQSSDNSDHENAMVFEKQMVGNTSRLMDIFMPAKKSDKSLIDATTDGDLQTIESILQKGSVDVNMAEGDGDEDRTPLIWATILNHRKIVTLLLQHGADADIQDKHGRTALHFAAAKGSQTIGRALLAANANPNAKDELQRTPLHEAASSGQAETLQLLLENGSSTDVTDHIGNTPLHLAVQENHPECVKQILKFSIKTFDIKDNVGYTPLGTAIQLCLTNVIQQIVDIIPDGVNQEDADGWTALHHAVNEGNITILKYLLGRSGVIVNHVGLTPLHVAVHNVKALDLAKQLSIVKLLLENGAYAFDEHRGKPHVYPKDSPLVHALQEDNLAIAEAIILHYNKEAVNEAKWNETLGVRDDNGWNISRLLIKQLPSAFKDILDGCVKKIIIKDTPFLGFHFNLLEDTCRNGKQYSDNHEQLKSMHPLMMIAKQGHEELLVHPVLKLLLRRKWKLASAVYLAFLLFYLSFVCCISAFMIDSEPPQANATETKCLMRALRREEGNFFHGGSVLSFFIVYFAIMGMLIQVVHCYFLRAKALKLTNLLDVTTYLMSCMILVDFSGCQIHDPVQWQLGAVIVFISWMNLLFNLSRLPKLGIYVVMVGKIMNTFLQFFALFFLFILAFAICFFLLLSNQYAFRNPFYSIINTWVMMVGEMNFADTFHSFLEETAHEHQLYFPATTYAIFVVFLTLVSLIIMNLLTGLAVSDVSKLEADSSIDLLRMRIEFALEFEFAMPSQCYERFVAKDWEEEYEKLPFVETQNIRVFTWIQRKLDRLFFGQLSIDTITREAKEILSQPYDENLHSILRATNMRVAEISDKQGHLTSQLAVMNGRLDKAFLKQEDMDLRMNLFLQRLKFKQTRLSQKQYKVLEKQDSLYSKSSDIASEQVDMSSFVRNQNDAMEVRLRNITQNQSEMSDSLNRTLDILNEVHAKVDKAIIPDSYYSAM